MGWLVAVFRLAALVALLLLWPLSRLLPAYNGQVQVNFLVLLAITDASRIKVNQAAFKTAICSASVHKALFKLTEPEIFLTSRLRTLRPRPSSAA